MSLEPEITLVVFVGGQKPEKFLVREIVVDDVIDLVHKTILV
jgi:hypothetical protein